MEQPIFNPYMGGLVSPQTIGRMMGINSIPEDSKEEPKEPQEASERNKRDWNDFLLWLDKKGVKGDAKLDKGNLGNKYFDEYLSTHKDTSLTKEIIPSIRKSYTGLRDYNIQQILAGKSTYLGKSGKDADVDNFMKHIVLNEQSSDPNYVGQHLTRTYFPSVGYKEYVNDKLTKSESKDIASPTDVQSVIEKTKNPSM